MAENQGVELERFTSRDGTEFLIRFAKLEDDLQQAVDAVNEAFAWEISLFFRSVMDTGEVMRRMDLPSLTEHVRQGWIIVAVNESDPAKPIVGAIRAVLHEEPSHHPLSKELLERTRVQEVAERNRILAEQAANDDAPIQLEWSEAPKDTNPRIGDVNHAFTDNIPNEPALKRKLHLLSQLSPWGEVAQLAVVRAAQKQGLGFRLMSAAENWLQSKGAKFAELTLLCQAHNAPRMQAFADSKVLGYDWYCARGYQELVRYGPEGFAAQYGEKARQLKIPTEYLVFRMPFADALDQLEQLEQLPEPSEALEERKEERKDDGVSQEE